MLKHLGAFAVLMVIIVLAYSNALSGRFMVDDHAFFDETMRNVKFIWQQFLPDKDKVLGVEGGNPQAFYRPLAQVIPMICYLNFKSNTTLYHITNLILFIFCAVFIYASVYFFFRHYWLALITALFYALHPINGVMVNYITASVFPVQVILMLTALLALIRLPLLSVVAFILSLMCHETAMALPFYALALCCIVYRMDLKQAFKTTGPFWFLLIGYFVFRLYYASLGNSILMNFGRFEMSPVEYLASVSKLTVWYLSKLFFPNGIVLTWSIPVVRHALGLWIITLVLILGVGGYLIYRYRKECMALLGLVWFAIGFIPFLFACVFQPVHGFWIEPHWFVFSLIGFFIFIAFIITHFLNKTWMLIVGMILVLCWGIMVRHYNYLWANEIRYCHYWLEEAPGFAGAQMSLGLAYELKKDYVNARRYYDITLAKNFRPYIGYTNLGLMDIVEGKWDDAKMHLEKALAINPHAAVALSNLGLIEFKNKNFQQAKMYFQKAILENAYAVLPRLNLAKTYLALNQEDEAIDVFNQILTIVPHHEITLVELIQLYMKQKDVTQTIMIAKELLATSNNPTVMNNLSIIFTQHGFFQEAAQAYRKINNYAVAN